MSLRYNIHEEMHNLCVHFFSPPPGKNIFFKMKSSLRLPLSTYADDADAGAYQSLIALWLVILGGQRLPIWRIPNEPRVQVAHFAT